MSKLKMSLKSHDLVGRGYTGDPVYLSAPDIVAGSVSIPSFYCYPNGLDPQKMLDALPGMLERYPDFCGRLKRDARGLPYVDGSDRGMDIQVYSVQGPMPDYGNSVPMATHFRQFYKLCLPWQAFRDETPVFPIRLFQFECGGSIMAIAPLHSLIDGSSVWTFLPEWAAAARGEGYPEPAVCRSKLIELSQQWAGSISDATRAREMSMLSKIKLYARLAARIPQSRPVCFDVPQSFIDNLREEALQEFPDARISGGDLLEAFCFKAMAGFSRQKSIRVGAVGDLRFRKHLEVPKRLFGAALTQLVTTHSRDEIIGLSPAALSQQLRQARRAQTDDDVKGYIASLEQHRQQGTLSRVVLETAVAIADGGHVFNNYNPFRIYEIDFGTGGPSWAATTGVRFRMLKFMPKSPESPNPGQHLHLSLSERELAYFGTLFKRV